MSFSDVIKNNFSFSFEALESSNRDMTLPRLKRFYDKVKPVEQITLSFPFSN